MAIIRLILILSLFIISQAVYFSGYDALGLLIFVLTIIWIFSLVKNND